jgi:hypothetical protein
MSPSDIVGPSPVTSNGTETTEIEDDVSEDLEKEVTDRKSTRRSELLMLTTNLPESVRQSSTEEAVSVIHAPESFSSWVCFNLCIQDPIHLTSNRLLRLQQ